MAKQQMNVRIEATVKQQGDAAFARVGYTPTQAVSLLWEVAAAAPSSAALQDTLTELEEHSVSSGLQSKSRLYKGHGLVTLLLKQEGLTLDPTAVASLRDDDLLADALLEKYGEPRG